MLFGLLAITLLLKRLKMEYKCNKCGRILEEPGALVFGPPMTEIRVDAFGFTHEIDLTRKYHVCVEKCWQTLAGWFYFK